MAKHQVFLHVGPAVEGISAPHAALAASPGLAEAGFAVPRVEQEVVDHAEVEILRRHKALGLRRKDVEGAWAQVCRRAFKAKSDVVVSAPGLLGADYQQAALALDGLVGLRMHLVLTPATPLSEEGTRALAGHWGSFARKSGRVHVLPMPAGTAPSVFAEQLTRLAARADVEEQERRLRKAEQRRDRARDRFKRLWAA